MFELSDIIRCGCFKRYIFIYGSLLVLDEGNVFHVISIYGLLLSLLPFDCSFCHVLIYLSSIFCFFVSLCSSLQPFFSLSLPSLSPTLILYECLSSCLALSVVVIYVKYQSISAFVVQSTICSQLECCITKCFMHMLLVFGHFCLILRDKFLYPNEEVNIWYTVL